MSKSVALVNDPHGNPIPPCDMTHGFAVNGHPKTWADNIVSLGAWRRLSDLEKYRSTGRIWIGKA